MIRTDTEGRLLCFDPHDRAALPGEITADNFHEWIYASGAFRHMEEEQPEPGTEERLTALEEMNALLTDCILELSERVWNGEEEA